MDNLNSSTFLGNVQCMVVKQLKNSDLHSIFHLFDMCNKVFSLNFGMGNLKASTSLDNVQWKAIKQLKDSDFHIIFHNATVTDNLF